MRWPRTRCQNAFLGGTQQGRCAVTAFIRLLGLLPAGAGRTPDQQLREVVLPGLQAQPGLLFAWAGRSHATEDGPRLVASVWESDSGHAEPPGELLQLFAFERAAQLGEATLEVQPLAVALSGESAGEARILRVFRGQARPAELESYVASAQQGAFAEVAAQHRPVALFLAVEPPDRFITVSVWTAWDDVEAATGGNLRQPIAMLHPQRLVAGEVAHYEVIPR